MKISVIAPVKNEVDFIGYSVMAVLPFIHEVIYAVAPSSNDGTIQLLQDIRDKYAHEKLKILLDKKYDFHPHDLEAYNQSFNDCIAAATGEAAWFLHPDMLALNPEVIPGIKSGPIAWWTNITSFAGDFQTVISKGRTDKWKNIHAKALGLHYFGGYGSTNEDFYHSQITGKTYRHHGDDFKKYPFEVVDSGLKVNHYCELKSYRRRLEKMKLCIKTQSPGFSDDLIAELAQNHPRVTLEPSGSRFGVFEFQKTGQQVPEIIERYKGEFSKYKEG
jgi:glycosyltransferase involved in cell wall biosynthesis